MYTYDRNSARRRSQRLRKPEVLLASKQPLPGPQMPRSSRLETHDHPTCGFMAWCRKSGAQVAGKLENPTAVATADGEKSARIDL